MSGIYTPKLYNLDFVCTKIPYKGYEISISMQPRIRLGVFDRSEIRVYSPDDVDVTTTIWPPAVDRSYVDIWATAETLLQAFAGIDRLVTCK